MAYLIEDPDSGERCFTASLDGYAGWVVVAEGAAAEPQYQAEFVDGEWRVDAAARAAVLEKAQIRAMKPEQLVAHILSRLPGR